MINGFLHLGVFPWLDPVPELYYLVLSSTNVIYILSSVTINVIIVFMIASKRNGNSFSIAVTSDAIEFLSSNLISIMLLLSLLISLWPYIKGCLIEKYERLLRPLQHQSRGFDKEKCSKFVLGWCLLQVKDQHMCVNDISEILVLKKKEFMTNKDHSKDLGIWKTSF